MKQVLIQFLFSIIKNTLIVFKDQKVTGNSEIFRVSFNTAFIGDSNMIEVDRW